MASNLYTYKDFVEDAKDCDKRKLEDSIRKTTFTVQELSSAELLYFFNKSGLLYAERTLNFCIEDTIKAFFHYMFENKSPFERVHVVHKGDFEFDKLHIWNNSLNVTKNNSTFFCGNIETYNDEFDDYVRKYANRLKNFVNKEVSVLMQGKNFPCYIMFNYFMYPTCINTLTNDKNISSLNFTNNHTFLDQNGRILTLE